MKEMITVCDICKNGISINIRSDKEDTSWELTIYSRHTEGEKRYDICEKCIKKPMNLTDLYKSKERKSSFTEYPK